MITNPSNLTEQLLNLVERIATEIKAIYNKLQTAVFTVNGKTPDADGNIEVDTSGVHVGSEAPEGDELLWVDPDASDTTTLDLGSTTEGKELLLRRGNTSEVAAFTGQTGELVVDTVTKSVHLQDGSTAGGIKLAKASEITALQSSVSTDIRELEGTVEDLGTSFDNLDVGVRLVNNTAPDASGNVNVDVEVTADKITDALGYVPLQTAPVTSVNGQTGAVNVNVPVTSVMGMTGAVTGLVKSVNGTSPNSSGNVTITIPTGTVSQKHSSTANLPADGTTTKTITGLTANKPLIIGVQATSSITSGFWGFIFRSGTVLTSSSDLYGDTGFSGGSTNPIWVTVIPTGTSISLYFDNYSGSSSGPARPIKIVAYQ